MQYDASHFVAEDAIPIHDNVVATHLYTMIGTISWRTVLLSATRIESVDYLFMQISTFDFVLNINCVMISVSLQNVQLAGVIENKVRRGGRQSVSVRLQ